MNQKHLAAFAAFLLFALMAELAWLFRYEHATQTVFLDRWKGELVILIPKPSTRPGGS